jgi:hypothetical protein
VRLLQLLHALHDQIIDLALPRLVVVFPNRIMLWVLLQPAPQERVPQPLFGGLDVGDGAEPDLGVEVLIKVEVERAFELGGPVS